MNSFSKNRRDIEKNVHGNEIRSLPFPSLRTASKQIEGGAEDKAGLSSEAPCKSVEYKTLWRAGR